MSKRKRRRVLIASRIFAPEPAAASFRLSAVADAVSQDGTSVTVLTTVPAPGGAAGKEMARADRMPSRVSVKRWPALRDVTGYVRGYLPYLSFDIPLFFRLLAAKRPDVVLVEPPPTTGVVSRVATALRRVPYVWYAADVWSDASEIAGSPVPVVSVVRWMERFALRGASGVIAVSDGVSQRVRELGARNVTVIPNGIDASVYTPDVRPLSASALSELGITEPYLVYAGTASEWQGAEVFAEAMEQLAAENLDFQLLYIGQGSQWEEIRQIAGLLRREMGRDVIVQLDPSSPEFVAQLLVGSRGALVSIVPDRGYDFAYPTKVLAALACGVPVLYAGKGPVVDDLLGNVLGLAVDHSPGAVASGIEDLLARGRESFDADSLREWAVENRSLAATGQNAAQFLREVEGGKDFGHERHSVAASDSSRPVVAVVTPWYPTAENAVSGLFVEREASALRAGGVDVRVVHLDRAIADGRVVRSLRDGIPVLHIGMNPANPASVARAAGSLRRVIAGVDVVNSHAISALPVVAVALGNRRGTKPWVHTEHWSALSSPQSASALLRVVRPAFASLLRLPDVVVAESERLANSIRRFRGDREVEIIPCIVPTPESISPLRGENGGGDPGADSVLRLYSTGGVIERKGPLLAVRTLAELKKRGVRASLRWIGEGDQRAAATALAAELGVDAEFLGAGSPDDVQRELAAADIFFGPTQGENFFVAAAEALVNGRPICASDQGGHVEYADPRFAEIVHEPTPEAYAEALIRLHDKTQGVKAEQIAASVSRLFSPEAVAAEYLRLYLGG